MNSLQDAYENLALPLTPQWAIVIVAAFAAYYALRAFHAARDQANHAKRQADAAEMQLAEIQRQSKIDNSPYVFFDRMSEYNFKDGEWPVVYLHYRNDGVTTAKNVYSKVSIKLGSDTLSED